MAAPLWDRLSTLLAQAYRDQAVRWILPIEILEIIDEPGVTLPSEIHVFGFSYLSHGFREMIERLDRRSTIELYTFAPVDWQPVVAASEASPTKSARRAGNVRITADRALDDDESIAIRWGRPGREHFEQVKRLAGDELNSEVVSVETTTTLGRLQAELLRAENKTDERFERDDSLVILACPGIRREAEIVANEIWRLVRDDDDRHGRSPDRLRFPDIAVLIADSANLAAYQASFRGPRGIARHPVQYGGPPFGRREPPARGCPVATRPAPGRVYAPELLKVLTHPAIRARFPEADAESWRSWCVDLEVVHGADRDDHQGTYIEGEVFHWDQGLRRLVLGAFMTGPRR